MDFHGKVVWITGASSGIGEALAKGLAHEGAAVVLSGRREAELQRVARELGSASLVLPFEVTDYDALPVLVEDVYNWRGNVDVLINNAGVSQRSLAIETDFAVYRRLMEIDYFAPVRLTQLVVPKMIARRDGLVAVVSSIAGKLGSPMRTGYCAAKHACVGFFDALRAEVEEPYGIRVSVVLPGSVRTAIATNALSADGSARGYSDANIENGMTPERAAEMSVRGLVAEKREILVAEGAELAAVMLRAQDPERLFDQMTAGGARLAVARAAASPGGFPP